MSILDVLHLDDIYYLLFDPEWRRRNATRS